MTTLIADRPVVKFNPIDFDTTDHAEPFEPTADDAAWWAEYCDHSDWTLDGELSPEEQDAELDHAEWLESRFRAAFDQDRYESGIIAW